jgi:mycofactocin precursor
VENLEAVDETIESGSSASEQPAVDPEIIEEICVEELAIDGICGVY